MPNIDVTIIGGGMITHDQLLPSLYHLQRIGAVGQVAVCARHITPLAALRDSLELREAFPGSSFRPYPGWEESAASFQPTRYRDAIAAMRPRQIVVVAVPDALHYEVVRAALDAEQHVICVKPLVQQHAHAVEIDRLARERALFVGVEYHKRFDRRALFARGEYAAGRFGTFVFGEARLHEPYSYRHSNFQNWFTCDQADPFTYIGCHYADLVRFITRLDPAAVSVDAVKGSLPNGNEAWLWSSARVTFENGALLTVTNSLGYPDEAAGTNDQGLVMYCEGGGRTGMINHDDHERGTRYSYLEPRAGARYRYMSPDYFRLVPWDGAGLKPVGYGYDSVAALVDAIRAVEDEAARGGEALMERRRARLREIDDAGLLATAGNSAVNDRLIEAARASLARGGVQVELNG